MRGDDGRSGFARHRPVRVPAGPVELLRCLQLPGLHDRQWHQGGGVDADGRDPDPGRGDAVGGPVGRRGDGGLVGHRSPRAVGLLRRRGRPGGLRRGRSGGGQGRLVAAGGPGRGADPDAARDEHEHHPDGRQHRHPPGATPGRVPSTRGRGGPGRPGVRTAGGGRRPDRRAPGSRSRRVRARNPPGPHERGRDQRHARHAGPRSAASRSRRHPRCRRRRSPPIRSGSPRPTRRRCGWRASARRPARPERPASRRRRRRGSPRRSP